MLFTIISGLFFTKKRKAMQLFPESVITLWNVWEIRTMVAISFGLQMILILLGTWRKHSTSITLRFVLWLAYLSSDAVATVSLGILSSNNQDDCEGDSQYPSNFVLTAFWAPFLLLHLGGPDTITAYSLADNELWLRHLLGLVVQVLVAFYVFLRAWSANILNFLAIPMFIVGIIKYVERTWVLRSASSEHFRDSMLHDPDPGPNYARFMEEYSSKKAEGFRVELGTFIEAPTDEDQSDADAANEDQSDADAANEDQSDVNAANEDQSDADAANEDQSDVNAANEDQSDVDAANAFNQNTHILLRAYNFYETFKLLCAELILSFHDIKKSQSFFRKTECKGAFEVIEFELGFIYDVFYTKAVLVYSAMGGILRCITLSLTASVLIAFFFTKKQAYRREDVIITYILLVGAIILEVYSVIILLSSDWTSLWLSKHKNGTVALLHRAVSSIPLVKKKRWSNTVAQFDLITFCLKGKPAKCIFIKKDLFINQLLEKYRYQDLKDVSEYLKLLIYKQLKKKLKEASNFEACKKLCARRGDWVLESEKCEDELIVWAINGVEFDQSILLWHIATDICYYSDVDNSQSREASKQLSNYMLYLLVMCPFMLPNGIGQIRFRDTCAEAEEFFNENKLVDKTDPKESCTRLNEVCTDIPPSKVKGDRSKSVLFDACRLAKALQSLKGDRDWNNRKWKLISYVWVEMLSYAANHCRWSDHAQQLRRGGELLTHVWLLMAHLGLTEQFQISEGHVRAKLIVE